MFLRDDEVPFPSRGQVRISIDLILLPGNQMPDGRLFRRTADEIRQALCDALAAWGYPQGTYYVPDCLQDGLQL